MPKGVAKGRSKGKTPARRKLQLDSSTTTSDRGPSSRPVASGSQSRPPIDLSSPEKPSGKIPPPPLLYKDGDTFSSVLEKYSGWKGNRLTPSKRELLYYTMVYHDDGEKGDDEKDVSQRMGIEGASEIIKESRVPKSVRKDAQVVGEVGMIVRGLERVGLWANKCTWQQRKGLGQEKLPRCLREKVLLLGGMKVREWGMAVYESW